jgi:hypothetical protein
MVLGWIFFIIAALSLFLAMLCFSRSNDVVGVFLGFAGAIALNAVHKEVAWRVSK